MANLTVTLWAVPVALVLYKVITFGSREKDLPPGPSTIPVLGNAHLIPAKGLHLKFKEWAEEYGPVYSLKLGGTTMIVLSDREAVFELMSRRGANYNSRPPDQQVEATLQHENMSMMYEGPLWRAQRKITATYLAPKNLDGILQPIQVAEVSYLMHDLLQNPDGFRDAVKRTTASLSTIVLFGHRALDLKSFWGYAVYRSIDQFNDSLAPGTYLPADHIPILKLIPERFNKPLLGARQSYRNISSIWAEARERVEERRRNGDKRESLMDRVLDEDIRSDVPLTYSQMNNFFGTMQMGAADTTSGHSLASILFLSQHPHVQEKARIELDRVCGTHRMPQWTDFEALPYINCIIKESLRMRAALPTGAPHFAKTDDWYKGMFIPKGSMIMVPPTAINFDNRYTEDPLAYNPDRFLETANKLSPDLAASSAWKERDHYTYGVGRRICPGMHLAERVQWRIMAQLLWAFRIEPEEKLSTGYDMYEEGFLHFVKDFKVKFVPRSEQHVKMVQQQFEENAEFLQRWD